MAANNNDYHLAGQHLIFFFANFLKVGRNRIGNE